MPGRRAWAHVHPPGSLTARDRHGYVTELSCRKNFLPNHPGQRGCVACPPRGARAAWGWRYGAEANRTTLEALTRYAYEQGVAARNLEPEELFFPGVLGHYLV